MPHNDRWIVLDRLAAENVFAMPGAIYAELVERIREAMLDPKSDELNALAEQLGELSRLASSKASDEARAAARRYEVTDSQSPADEAFALGRIGLAYQLVASVADKRVDANFAAMLADPVYAPYLHALLDQELSGVELAQRLGQAKETVSRNIGPLRDAGAVGYRGVGTSKINFLTPVARQMLEDSEERDRRTRLAEPVRDWVKREFNAMPAELREVQTFAHETARDRDALVGHD